LPKFSNIIEQNHKPEKIFMPMRAYILLGGNRGDVQTTFQRALEHLRKYGEVVGQSGLYKSAPWGMETEHMFLNQAVILETTHSPGALLEELLYIERELGRVREQKSVGYTDRVLDLDILLIDDLVIKEPELCVPHPRMHLRKFTLMPLVEIAPEKQHPVLLKSMTTLLEECADEHEVVKYAV
jgi:2-amino-4-hydroxy-6-hydroxymethyldihydropteridine diphosphokinase